MTECNDSCEKLTADYLVDALIHTVLKLTNYNYNTTHKLESQVFKQLSIFNTKSLLSPTRASKI